MESNELVPATELLRKEGRALEKYQLIIDAQYQLSFVNSASQKDTRDMFAGGSGNRKMTPTFSEHCSRYEGFTEEHDAASLKNGLRRTLEKYYRSNSDILDPSFEFSEYPEEFQSEIVALEILFFNESVSGISSLVSSIDQEAGWKDVRIPEKDDPRLELALMKALFHAGKVVGRLKHEGKTKIDIPTNAGRAHKENRYSDHEIVGAFPKCEGNNVSARADAIWNFLNDTKKRTGSKKDVPHTSTIKRTLKEHDLHKKLRT